MSNSTKKKMQKYPAQYFLQKKVNEVLFEKKSKITTVSILREGVKDNLKKFRAYFQTHFPVTDHPKDIIKRNNEIATIKGKYIFDVYFRHITEIEINPTIQDQCLFLENKKTNSRTIKNFLKRDYTFNKSYKETEVLDFLSIYLGFEGWNEALSFDFDIANKPLKEIEKNNHQEDSFDAISFTDDIVEKISDATFDKISVLIKNNYQPFSKEDEEKWILEIENAPLVFIQELFDEVVSSKKLKKATIHKIEFLFNPEISTIEFEWQHRAIFASGLSTSILKGWDEQKILLLKKLLLYKDEPLVVERAMVGITLSLIVSFSNVAQFEKTIALFSDYKEESSFNLGIYEAVRYFFYELETRSFLEEELKLFTNFKRIHRFQYVEPIHKDLSYYKIEEKNINVLKDEKKFFSLLNSSFSFRIFERLKILLTFNNLDAVEIEKLYEALESEQINYQATFKKFGKISKEIGDRQKLQASLEEFVMHIVRLNDFSDVFLNLLKRVDKSFFIKTVFEAFPHHSYLTILDKDIVISKLTENQPKYLSYLSKETLEYVYSDRASDQARSSYEFYLKSLNITDFLNYEKVKKYSGEVEEIAENPAVIKQAITNFREEIPHNLASSRYFALGNNLRDLALLENTPKAYHKAIKYYKKSVDAFENVFAIGEMGKCLQRIAELENKPELYFEDRDLYVSQEQEDQKKLPLLKRLGEQFKRLAEAENKIQYYKTAIKYFKKRQKIEVDAIIAYMIAEIYWKIKKYAKAAVYLKQVNSPALEKEYQGQEDLEYTMVKILSPLYLAYIALINKNEDEAFSYFQETLEIRGDGDGYNGFFWEYDQSYGELEEHAVTEEQLDAMRIRLVAYCKEKLDKKA